MANPIHKHIDNYDQPLATWVLVADGNQARIYECHKIVQKIPLGGANKHHYCEEKSGYQLVSVLNGAMKAESMKDYQIGHDRRGTSSSSHSPTHNTYEPHGNINEELKRRFIKIIADRLQQARVARVFNRLILVMPARMIGELKQQLAVDVQNSIVAIVPKDLTHYHGEALMPHLHDTLAAI